MKIILWLLWFVCRLLVEEILMKNMKGLLILTFFIAVCCLISIVTLSGNVHDSRVRIDKLEKSIYQLQKVRIDKLEKSIYQLQKVKLMDQMEEIEYLTDLGVTLK